MEENDKKKKFIKSLNTQANYELILTEECFLLLEKVNEREGKIAFWSSLFAITDLQINKSKKITTINFYDDENDTEFQLKLNVDNILLFRDSLANKMRNLQVKISSQKLIKGQEIKRISEKEIRSMKINDIEKNTKELSERILKGEINDYTVNTFSKLCGKAIEFYSVSENVKYMEYADLMRVIFKLEGVDKFTKEKGD